MGTEKPVSDLEITSSGHKKRLGDVENPNAYYVDRFPLLFAKIDSFISEELQFTISWQVYHLPI